MRRIMQKKKERKETQMAASALLWGGRKKLLRFDLPSLRNSRGGLTRGLQAQESFCENFVHPGLQFGVLLDSGVRFVVEIDNARDQPESGVDKWEAESLLDQTPK